MELRHLRYFVAVGESLSFSRAAARLRLTQPALSRQIRDLEEELGGRLLLRGRGARTELTPEGRLLLEGARRLLAEAGELARQVRDRAARLGFGHYGALWLDYFSPALRRFSRRHPEVRLEPIERTPRELVGALRRGEVAVALIGLADTALRREFHVARVATYPVQLALAAHHPLAKKRRIKLAELRTAEWVTWDEREFPGRKHQLVAACRAAGFRPRIAHETDSLASMFLHVATSGAVGQVLPMARLLPHEGVVFSDVDPPGAFASEIQVAWRRDDPRAPLIDALVKELAAVNPATR